MIGTAINAVDRASLNIDLEPTAVAKKRANQKKMPAIITGAVIAVLGAAAYAVTGYMGVEKAKQTLSGVSPTVSSIKSEQSALRLKEQELKKMGRHPRLLPAADSPAVRLCGHYQTSSGTVGTQELPLLVHGF